MLKAGGPHPLPATPPHPALPWRVTGSGSRGFSTVLWHPLLPPPPGWAAGSSQKETNTRAATCLAGPDPGMGPGRVWTRLGSILEPF